MSQYPTEDDCRDHPDVDDVGFEIVDAGVSLEENLPFDDLGGRGNRPRVPEGVHRGIEDIDEGRTADVDDIESVLDY